MNQAEFYLANQVDGQLTDAQTMRMLDLSEGDTVASAPESGVPDAATVPVTPTEVAKAVAVEAAPASVVQAKDGVHTIPFEKLTEAREEGQHWKRIAAEQLQQLEAFKNAPPAVAAEALQEIAKADGADIFGDYSEESIAKGIEKMVDARTAAIEKKFQAQLAQVMEPIQARQVESATDAHFSAIGKAHPDASTIAVSPEMAAWIAAQPSFARAGYQAVLDQGSATEVIEMLDSFKASTGKLVVAPVKTDVAAAAAAAIARAQSAPPSSLSEIPAGASVQHDEHAAMLEMSTTGLMARFDGKSPEQIMALMSRAL